VPIIIAAGFDPIWFGVILTINMEIGLSSAGGAQHLHRQCIAPDCADRIMWGTLPYVICMMLQIVLLCAFPEIAPGCRIISWASCTDAWPLAVRCLPTHICGDESAGKDMTAEKKNSRQR